MLFCYDVLAEIANISHSDVRYVLQRIQQFVSAIFVRE